MRPPEGPLFRLAARNVENVQAEIAQEKAASLGRMASRLMEALKRLEEGSPAERPERLSAAGEALWYYVVQREACGLRDVETVLREYRVPREVYLRMGLARRSG